MEETKQSRRVLAKRRFGNHDVVTSERGIWQYQEDRPTCKDCGLPARYHTKNEDGSVRYWRNICTMCHKNRGQKQYKYRLNKKTFCEMCGFVAKHRVQLDVDHIDGNHKNDNESNLQTICANCHRLKTVLWGDHNGKVYEPLKTGLLLH